MTVAYVSAGASIRASQLNSLTAELDAILRCAYGDKSFFAYNPSIVAIAGVAGDRFFFGDSANWKVIPEVFGSVTEYDHTTFETNAAALSVDNYDATTHVANVIDDGTWTLDGSLEAHKVEHDSEDYFYNQVSSGGKQLQRERYRRLDVAEIVMEKLTGDELTWDTKWNRYHFLRFHNLDAVPVDVILPGSVTITIPAFGIKAVRRTYPNVNTYDQTHVYLWAARSGDLLFWRSGKPGNNVASLCYFHEALDILRNAAIAWPKPSVFWNGASRLPVTLEGSAVLYKLKHRLGELCSVEDAAGGTPIVRRFTPTWAELIAGTNAVKLTESTLTVAANTGATTPVDLIGFGSTMGPRWPDALPWAADTTAASPTAPGAPVDNLSMSGTWYDEFDAPTTVTTDYDYYAVTANVWQMDGRPVDHLNTVTEATTFADAAAGEGTTKPTCTTGSDGWQVIAYGTVTFDDDLGMLPVGDATEGYGYPWFTFGSTAFTYHFGQDLTGRWSPMSGGDGEDAFYIVDGTHGRRTSDYVGYTAAGVVTHEGHTDLTGHEPMDGGVDFNEARVEPTTATILREEVLPSTYTPTTTGMPDITPAEDALERIESNIDSAWYASNRTDLLAQTMDDEDNQTILRVPILGIHYNHVAGRLNAIHWITPQTIATVPYYGLGDNGLADRTWPIAHHPEDWGCGVLATGSRAAALGLTITGTSTESHLTNATIAAHAASLGLRYFVRRISRFLDASGDPTRDDTDTRRFHIGTSARIYGWVEDSYGDIQPPEDVSNPADKSIYDPNSDACLAEIEEEIEDGPTLPTGWQWAGDDKLLTRPIPIVAFVNDPLVDPEMKREEMEEVAALALAPTFWPVASAPATLTTQDIADLYAAGTVDPRAAWVVQVANRFIITRT